MIASISGEVIHKDLESMVIEAAGVGYLLSVSSYTLESTPNVGARAVLHTEMVVREDAMQLFGFDTVEERALFKQLTTVNGVGPKVALAVLSSMTVADAETALLTGDHERFQKVPGIGKRTAERLVLELRDKIVPSGAPAVSRSTAQDESFAVALEALLELGYSLARAEDMLAGVSGDTAEDLVSSALRGVAV
ncbi:MAG: Holliday junction branch migration protein RuvA [Solirubrobacterales bacterium]